MEDIRFVFDAITAIIQQVKAEVFLERFNVMLIRARQTPPPREQT